MTDIIVAGGGPAGLTAALYAVRAGRSVLVLEEAAPGGQINFSPLVENYPGLPGNKYHALAKKYMPDGTCGVVSFGVKGGREAASRFMAGLELASIATHVADAKTCVLHPASSTHRQLSEAELAAAGVSADLIRLSVGIEDITDILADLEQALDQV